MRKSGYRQTERVLIALLFLSQTGQYQAWAPSRISLVENASRQSARSRTGLRRSSSMLGSCLNLFTSSTRFFSRGGNLTANVSPGLSCISPSGVARLDKVQPRQRSGKLLHLLHHSPSSPTTTTAIGETLGTCPLTILDTRRSTELRLAVLASLNSRGWPSLITPPSSVSIVKSKVRVSILRG